MVKKSTPEDPSQDDDDLLSDDGLDDLDIEALLEDDIEEAKSSGQAPDLLSSSGAGDGDPFDDGEIDLLADDDIDLGSDTPELAAESPTADPSVPADDAGSFLTDDPPEATAVVGGESEDVDGSETLNVVAADAAKEDAPSKKGAGKKKRFGRKKKSKKEKSKRGAPGSKIGKKLGEKAKAKKQKKAKAKKPKPIKEKKVKARAAVGRQRAVAFICSECYEEFLLPSNYSQEMVTCPECLHVGKKPDADFLRTVNVHKAGQRRSLMLAALSGIVLLVLVLSTIYMTSDMYVAQGAPESTTVLGLVGGSAALMVLFLWLVVRFEKNRWEVYF